MVLSMGREYTKEMNKILVEVDKAVANDTFVKEFTILCVASAYNLDESKRMILLITGDTSTGKSYVPKKITNFLDSKSLYYFTRISPTALENFVDIDWNNKVLFLEDVTYQALNNPILKVFMTEGSQTLKTDINTGEVVTRTIKGKPAMIMTSASTSLQRETTTRVFKVQPDTKTIAELVHCNLIRTRKKQQSIYDFDLKPYKVIIPFVEDVAKAFVPKYNNPRCMRDFDKLVLLIEAHTILNQREREIVNEQLIATKGDYDYICSLWNSIQQQDNNVFMEGLLYRQKLTLNEIKNVTQFFETGFKHFCVGDLASSTENLGSLKTVYRTIEALCNDGQIRFIKQEDGAKTNYYEYLERDSRIFLPEFKDLVKEVE